MWSRHDMWFFKRQADKERRSNSSRATVCTIAWVKTASFGIIHKRSSNFFFLCFVSTFSVCNYGNHGCGTSWLKSQVASCKSQVHRQRKSVDTSVKIVVLLSLFFFSLLLGCLINLLLNFLVGSLFYCLVALFLLLFDSKLAPVA